MFTRKILAAPEELLQVDCYFTRFHEIQCLYQNQYMICVQSLGEEEVLQYEEERQNGTKEYNPDPEFYLTYTLFENIVKITFQN